MSPIAQQTAIAEALGWTKLSVEDVWRSPVNTHHDRLPNFLHDLNASFQFEEYLFKAGNSFWEDYERHLRAITLRDGRVGGDLPKRLIRATATQRCEAFLKSIGKWVDEK